MPHLFTWAFPHPYIGHYKRVYFNYILGVVGIICIPLSGKYQGVTLSGVGIPFLQNNWLLSYYLVVNLGGGVFSSENPKMQGTQHMVVDPLPRLPEL